MTVTDEMLERAWAAIVGSDIAPMCFQASIIRADLRTALEAVDIAQAAGGCGDEIEDLRGDAATLRGFIREFEMTPSMMASERDHWRQRALKAEGAGEPQGSRLTFCEVCNGNTMHRRASIVDGVQTFECQRCALSSTNQGGGK